MRGSEGSKERDLAVRGDVGWRVASDGGRPHGVSPRWVGSAWFFSSDNVWRVWAALNVAQIFTL